MHILVPQSLEHQAWLAFPEICFIPFSILTTRYNERY